MSLCRYSELYKRQHAQLWQEKRRWSRRGLLSSFSAVFCLCVRGWEWKAVAVLGVWLQTDGLMARSNKQSLDIRFKSLSALWKTRCKPLLYLCHNDYAIWVCDIERAEKYVVIQYCTSALPAVHRDHCLVGLWLKRNWRVGRHHTNKGVFTKCGVVSEACSSCLSACPLCSKMGWEIRSLPCSLQQLDWWK